MKAARALFERLQWGRRSTEVKHLHRPEGAPRDFAQLGEWVDMVVATPGGLRTLRPEPHGAPPVLAVAARTGDLWLLGAGVVEVDRALVGAPIRRIAYATQKGRDPAGIYEHAFQAPYPLIGRGIDGHLHIARGHSTYTVKRAGIIG